MTCEMIYFDSIIMLVAHRRSDCSALIQVVPIRNPTVLLNTVRRDWNCSFRLGCEIRGVPDH